VGSLDLPDQPDASDGSRRVERVDVAGADRPTPKPRELPDPDERGRVYEAMRVAGVSAETPGEASRGQGSDGPDRRSYRNEVPRFFDALADHERRWPAGQRPTADRSHDPPGSYRSDGGFYLSPKRHAETVEAISRVREIEPGVSGDMQATERENRYGGWLQGFEHRLKGEDRLKEKVAETLKAEPRKTASQALREVPDAVRYTFCFHPENYTKGYYDIKESLERRGYEMYQSANSWTHAEYKGINTRWVTADGQRFEVQFHTPDSFHAKQYVTHVAYARIRNPLTSDAERAELKEFQREVSSCIQAPEGAADIPDFKKKGF
jgi:hypothetical protein